MWHLAGTLPWIAWLVSTQERVHVSLQLYKNMKAWIKLDSLTSWLLSVDWRCSMGKTICQNGTHDQAEPCLICSIYHLLCCWCGSALLEHESCKDGDGKKSTASTRLESSVFTFLQMLTCFCTFKHHILANTTIVQIQFWLFMISGHV